MNIMIVSRDNFFVTGAIALILQAWRADLGSHPIFIVADKNQPPLLPDVVVSDEPGEKERHGSSEPPGRQRRVTVSLTAQYYPGQQSSQQEATVSLTTKEAAKWLVDLFSNRNSPLFPSLPLSLSCRHRQQRGDKLSRQQTMVLKYTRQGMSLTDISRVTQLSVKTISTHKRAIMRKLGIKNNGEFYQYAFSQLQ